MGNETKKGAGADSATPLTPEEEIANLKAELAAEKDASAKKDEALVKSKELIQEQGEALATKEIQAASKNPVVMVDKTHYAFLGKGNIIIDGDSFTAKEVMADQAKLKYLLKIGSGMIKKITPKKGGK